MKNRSVININEVMTKKRITSFLARLDYQKDTDCFIWTGSVAPSGYGRMCIRVGKKTIAPKAHRVAFFLDNPDEDASRYIKHRCDNKLCCNPRHLVAV